MRIVPVGWLLYAAAPAAAQSLEVTQVLPATPHLERLDAVGDPPQYQEQRLNFEMRLHNPGSDWTTLDHVDITYFNDQDDLLGETSLSWRALCGGLKFGPSTFANGCGEIYHPVPSTVDPLWGGPTSDVDMTDVVSPGDLFASATITDQEDIAPYGQVDVRHFVGVSFDEEGDLRWLVDVPFQGYQQAAANAVLKRPRDVLLAGWAQVPADGPDPDSGPRVFALAELSDEDGELSLGFGKVTTLFGGCSAWAQDVEEVQVDQRLVYVAIGQAECGLGGEIAMAAYDGSGNLFPGFNGNGKVQDLISDGPVTIGGGAVDRAGDWIYVVGGLQDDLLVARYNEAGKLDAGYGNGGIVRIDPPEHRGVVGHEAHVLSDGRLVVVGEGQHSDGEIDGLVFVLRPGGSLDLSFGGTGYVVESIAATNFQDQPVSRLRDLVVDERQQRLLAAGQNAWSRSGIVAYRLDGHLDVAFGVGGRMSHHEGQNAAGAGLSAHGDHVIIVSTTEPPDGAPSSEVDRLIGARVHARNGHLASAHRFPPGAERWLLWPGLSFSDTPLTPDDPPTRIRIDAFTSADFADPPAFAHEVFPTSTVWDGFLFPARSEDLGPDHYWWVIGDHDNTGGVFGLRQEAVPYGDGYVWPSRYAYILAARDVSLGYASVAHGLPVHPMADGEIVWCAAGLPDNGGGSYICDTPNCRGNEVHVRHPNGLLSVYGHLQDTTSVCGPGIGEVNPPIPVTRDTVIGLVGDSGPFSSTLYVALRDAQTGDGVPLYWPNVDAVDGSNLTDPVDEMFGNTWELIAQQRGALLKILEPPPPPPPPPTNCDLVQTWDVGGPDGHPDGNYDIAYYCPDDDGEAVCVEAQQDGNTYGDCVLCGPSDRAEGCTCTEDTQCAAGATCWGTDAGPPGPGGATGWCYEDVPSWQCTHVCTEQYGAGAWCDNDHWLEARCYDGLTGEMMAEVCHTDPGGPLMAYADECIVECDVDADCPLWGYPDNYLCGTSWGGPTMCFHPSKAP